uniref:G-protein coupled receptors family 2 profile 2 domain-containing protein n=1 Tax=Megaselia scalaris TaxID=36166 RepID=T1GZG3_MEGSC
NYFWVFCEGLHLHLALVVVFAKDSIATSWFLIIGWGLPLFYILFYALFSLYLTNGHPKCGMENEHAIWILSIPVSLSLICLFIILVNLLIVLYNRIQSQSKQSPMSLKRAIKTTFILVFNIVEKNICLLNVPLFGLQLFLIPFRPSENSAYEVYYELVSVFLVSLQGLFVSLLYCFANPDVICAFRVFLNRVMPTTFAPVPLTIHSGTGHIGTTTPSNAEVAF